MVSQADSIDAFLKTVEGLENLLPHTTFNYCAVRRSGDEFLLQSRIFFNTNPPSEPFGQFVSEHIRAGQYRFSDLNISARKFISDVLNGVISTPHGYLVFPPKSRHPGYDVTFQPLHPAGLGQRNRLGVLHIEGDERKPLVDTDMIDWHLRGEAMPYDSLQELLTEYRLGFISEFVTFEAVSPTVVQVDLVYKVQKSKAEIGVLLAAGLPTEKVSLGYRVLSGKKVAKRGRIEGAQLTWESQENVQKGRIEIDVPEASIVHCMAAYEGSVVNFGFIVDPENVQNDRRTTYEAFDPGLVALKELLFRPSPKGIQARDFEAAVSWLLWMLGFNVALLGLIPKLQEAPDLVANAPSGHYLVIECTMGLLKAENKLATVVRRSAQVRDKLAASGSSHLKVTPVMVTSLSREEVAAELEQAERSGVLVFTREDLEGGLERTLMSPDAEETYRNAIKAADEALAKYEKAATAEIQNSG